MQRIEDKIQAEIVKFLQENKIFFHSIPNEGAGGNVARLSRLISMGLRKGCADLLVLLYKRPVYIEVKAPDEGQSHLQKVFESNVEELGYEYYVVRSVKEVANILNIRY